MNRRPDLFRRATAEALGVFTLVFAGCGPIVTEAERPGTLGAVGIGIVFGLVVMTMVYATGHLSGAHLNPAVTLAFVLTGRTPRRLSFEADARWADVVVTMGCGDECPYIPGRRYLDWDLPDPKGMPVESVRELRERIVELDLDA